MSDLRDHSPPAQPLQDLQACPMEPGLDGSYRPPDGQSNVFIRLPLLMEQQEDAAVFGAQLLKRIMNLADQLGGVVHRGSGGNVLQVVYGFRPSCSLC